MEKSLLIATAEKLKTKLQQSLDIYHTGASNLTGISHTFVETVILINHVRTTEISQHTANAATMNAGLRLMHAQMGYLLGSGIGDYASDTYTPEEDTETVKTVIEELEHWLEAQKL